MIKTYEYKSIAKINLFLRIIEKRNDGFHNLETLFSPIPNLYDRLTFKIGGNSNNRSNISELPIDDSNLIIKAKKLLESTIGRKLNTTILLEKNIPIGAGLGGGSSNAATTLIALNDIFDLAFSRSKLSELALQLGSDVPFFLLSKPALAFGRGELLHEIDFSIKGNLLIVNPGIHISTKMAFEMIIPKKTGIDWNNSNNLNISNFSNDFENVIFNKFPQVAEIKSIMLKNNSTFASLSGTGSTVFGFFENESDLSNCIDSLPTSYLKLVV